MPAFKIGPAAGRHTVWPVVLVTVLVLGIGMWALETGREWVNLTLAAGIVLWRLRQARRVRATTEPE